MYKTVSAGQPNPFRPTLEILTLQTNLAGPARPDPTILTISRKQKISCDICNDRFIKNFLDFSFVVVGHIGWIER